MANPLNPFRSKYPWSLYDCVLCFKKAKPENLERLLGSLHVTMLKILSLTHSLFLSLFASLSLSLSPSLLPPSFSLSFSLHWVPVTEML